MNRLPTWLTRCKIVGTQQRTLAADGLLALLDALLLAGAGHRHSSNRLLLASETVPDGRIGALRRRLGVSQDDLVPNSRKHLSGVERKVRESISAQTKLIAPNAAQGEYYRFLELAYIRLLIAMKGANRFDAAVTPRDLVRIGTRYSERRGAASHPGQPAFAFWSQSPPDLISVAHEALSQSNGNDQAIVESDMDSLMILGAACFGLRSVQECKWCYRWSLPGSALCVDHTHSGHARVDPRVRQREYRRADLARLVSQRFSGVEHPDKHSDKKHLLLQTEYADEDLSLYIGRVLWRVTSPAEQEIAERLVKLIQRSAIVARLGFDAEALTICGIDDFLRQRLEPGQWLPVHWEWKLWTAALSAFDQDYKIASAELHSKLGLETRLAAAIQAAVEHRCHSLTAVAEHLNVSPSTVSKWLRRSSSPKVAKLRELISTNHFQR